MKILKVCSGKQRGDLELQENNYKTRENGQRCYSCGANFSHYMEEYSSKGMIGGISYFREDRPVIEKIWWALCLILSLWCGVWLILRSYEKWQSSPVIVSFATKESPIWEVPFPMITICPFSQISKMAYNYTHYRHRRNRSETLTDEETKNLAYMDIFCRAEYESSSKSMRFADEEMLELFDTVGSKMLNLTFGCKFNDDNYECADLWKRVHLEMGICYTFNLMDRTQMLSDSVVHYKKFHETNKSHDWNIENGFNKSSGSSTYPRRATRAGDLYALVIRLKIHADDIDYSCGGAPLRGYVVYIGHSYTMPNVNQQNFVIPLGKMVKTGISPRLTTISEEVKRYTPQQRNCYLSSERPLKYFKIYTQSNCALECETNFTLQQCGCVKFYMPREAGTPICGPGVGECLKRVEQQSDDYEDVLKADAKCACLPGCTSLDYDVDSTQIEWDWRHSYRALQKRIADTNDANLDMSKLTVSFKSKYFLASERNELYGSPEFIANVGGLLGLFIGLTALSLVEIIYYLSLRIICNIYMFGKGNWSGNTD